MLGSRVFQLEDRKDGTKKGIKPRDGWDDCMFAFIFASCTVNVRKILSRGLKLDNLRAPPNIVQST